MKYSAWYGILIGFFMIAQWVFSIVTDGVPEFKTTPWAITFHLAAEFSTAFMLLIGGTTLLRAKAWGNQVLFIGLGMVIYSEIVSPGYFAEQGQWAPVLMFAVLLFGAVFAVIPLARSWNLK